MEDDFDDIRAYFAAQKECRLFEERQEEEKERMAWRGDEKQKEKTASER